MLGFPKLSSQKRHVTIDHPLGLAFLVTATPIPTTTAAATTAAATAIATAIATATAAGSSSMPTAIILDVASPSRLALDPGRFRRFGLYWLGGVNNRSKRTMD